MIVRSWRKPDTVTLTVTVASVCNHLPLIGFSDDVEKAWRSLMKKHNLRKRDKGQLCKVASSTQVLDVSKAVSSTCALLEVQPETSGGGAKKEGVVKSNTGNDVISSAIHRETSITVDIHLIRKDAGAFSWNRGRSPERSRSPCFPSMITNCRKG